jgi:hypothetical protein
MHILGVPLLSCKPVPLDELSTVSHTNSLYSVGYAAAELPQGKRFISLEAKPYLIMYSLPPPTICCKTSSRREYFSLGRSDLLHSLG